MVNKDVAVTGTIFLTEAQFQQLADVPTAMTWFANIDNPETRRAYQNDVEEFMKFAGIVSRRLSAGRPCAHPCLAPRPGTTYPWRRYYPAQTRGAILDV